MKNVQRAKIDNYLWFFCLLALSKCFLLLPLSLSLVSFISLSLFFSPPSIHHCLMCCHSLTAILAEPYSMSWFVDARFGTVAFAILLLSFAKVVTLAFVNSLIDVCCKQFNELSELDTRYKNGTLTFQHSYLFIFALYCIVCMCVYVCVWRTNRFKHN